MQYNSVRIWARFYRARRFIVLKLIWQMRIDRHTRCSNRLPWYRCRIAKFRLIQSSYQTDTSVTYKSQMSRHYSTFAHVSWQESRRASSTKSLIERSIQCTRNQLSRNISVSFFSIYKNDLSIYIKRDYKANYAHASQWSNVHYATFKLEKRILRVSPSSRNQQILFALFRFANDFLTEKYRVYNINDSKQSASSSSPVRKIIITKLLCRSVRPRHVRHIN